jgi:hypothetical protein
MIGAQIYRGQGLGNQLWTYAVIRSIAKKNGYQFAIVGQKYFKANRFLKLDFGKPVNTIISEKPVYRIPEGFNNYYAEKIVLHPKYKCDISPLDDNLLNISDGTFIDGNMQSENYILSFKNEISKWFKVEGNVFNGCTINFRGIEYEGLKEVLLPSEYYERAISYLIEKYGPMEFRVVTDDYTLAKKFFPNLPIIGRNKCKTLVDSKKKSLNNRLSIGPNQMDIARDFSLVQNSKYLIIPNSSFSWWAAWTNDVAREVVAPKYWGRHNISDGFWSTGDILTQGWTWLDRDGNFMSSKECKLEKENKNRLI